MSHSEDQPENGIEPPPVQDGAGAGPLGYGGTQGDREALSRQLAAPGRAGGCRQGATKRRRVRYEAARGGTEGGMAEACGGGGAALRGGCPGVPGQERPGGPRYGS